MKLYFILLVTFLSLNATTYECKIDVVKHLNTDKYSLLKKGTMLPTVITLKNKTAYVKIPKLSQVNFKLPYKGSRSLGEIKYEIYEKDGVQLEVVDISNSWSAGARLFMANVMFGITYCKH